MAEIGRKICSTKNAYPNASLAKDASDRAFLTRRIMLRWYECKYCNKWHLTSKSPQNYEKRLQKFGGLAGVEK